MLRFLLQFAVFYVIFRVAQRLLSTVTHGARKNRSRRSADAAPPRYDTRDRDVADADFEDVSD